MKTEMEANPAMHIKIARKRIPSICRKQRQAVIIHKKLNMNEYRNGHQTGLLNPCQIKFKPFIRKLITKMDNRQKTRIFSFQEILLFMKKRKTKTLMKILQNRIGSPLSISNSLCAPVKSFENKSGRKKLVENVRVERLNSLVPSINLKKDGSKIQEAPHTDKMLPAKNWKIDFLWNGDGSRAIRRLKMKYSNENMQIMYPK